jgi:hypothetical protein
MHDYDAAVFNLMCCVVGLKYEKEYKVQFLPTLQDQYVLISMLGSFLQQQNALLFPESAT